MKASVSFRPQARSDLLEQMLYLDKKASVETAIRFLQAVFDTCELLGRHPQMGRAFLSENARLKGIRSFALPRPFKNYLLFYSVEEKRVEVVRVLHGSREIEGLLADEET